jgi:predicted transcriptional regulator with HTH domain
MSERKFSETELAILHALRAGLTDYKDISSHVLKIVAARRQYGGGAAMRGFGARITEVFDNLIKEGIIEKHGGILSKKYVLTEKGKNIVEKLKDELDKISP